MDLSKLVSQMTLQQKAAQLTQFSASIMNDPDHPELTGASDKTGATSEDIALAGSAYNISGPEARIRLQQEHLNRDPNRIPLVFMQDVIHGFRSVYPIPLGMAATFDPELVTEMASLAAEEATAAGIEMTFSPMVDLSRDARWGRVMESAGEDVYLGRVMAAAQVKGYVSNGLQSCVKHYAAYGAGEAGRDYNSADMSEARLKERYLPPYKAAIDAGAKGIMPSFNSVNGVPSVGNKLLMNDILRKEWGFDGIVVSDYGAVGELISHGVAEDSMDAAEMALECGCHLEMMSANYCKSLQKLLDAGRVTMEQIDACVLKLLQFKEELGLFDTPNGKADREKFDALIHSKESRIKIRRAAEEAAVLLKNDGVLPLSDGVKKVAVIGPFGDDWYIKGAWTQNIPNEAVVTVLQGIKNRLPHAEVRFAQGCSGDLLSEDLSQIEEAAALADWADAVILTLGERGNQSGEGHCRTDLELSPAQLALFRECNKRCANTVVLLLCGRPLALTELDRSARAILCMWQPGNEGGNAAASLLFGDVCPSGRLPMSFPYHVGQEPISYDMYHTGRLPKDMLHSMGNTYVSAYLDSEMVPLYPFGYGLSYTTFEVEDMSLSAATMAENETLTVSATLRNTGDREAVCVPQLYIRDCVGSRVRPMRELKGFCRVSIKPQEQATVQFEITEPMLRFETLNNGFASEKGRFEAIVALDAHSGKALPFTLV